MKRCIGIVLYAVCILLVLTSCKNTNHDEILTFSFDRDGNYIGFEDLPNKYTVEEAEADGFFVTKDNDVVGNNDLWDDFIKTSSEGENASIRIVSFFTEGNSNYFSDLYYVDSKYYLFNDSSKDQEKHPYSYLLLLERDTTDTEKAGGIVVLTDDNTLSYSQVWKALLSSNMEYIKSVPKYEIVRFWNE